MPVIKTFLLINAPLKVCFDLARSIDIHMASTSQTEEKAIAGKTSGFIELNETVTWEAIHFGIRQRLSVKITEMASPDYFVDEMVKGAFKRFRHVHEFESVRDGTLMTDIFDYTAPFGIFGRLADRLFLKSYMSDFLQKRNEYIKKLAEGEQEL